MRAVPSAPEAVLWRCLVNRKLGVSFRRQVVLGPHCIADFVCASHKLVVEVDGAQHARRAQADARRDARLSRRGYRVLRIDAQLVLRAMPLALERIRETLAELG